MAGILRGDVVWAELDPKQGHEQSGRRPVVVLSHDVFNERSGTVIACALTSQEPRAGFPLTLELAGAKLPRRSWVKISQIRTLSAKRLGKKLGTVSFEELVQVIEGLDEIIGASGIEATRVADLFYNVREIAFILEPSIIYMISIHPPTGRNHADFDPAK